jgi:predicted PurR-regulated permease PerM
VQYVNRDFQRLNHSFVTLVSDNEEQLDRAGHRVKEAISGLYDFEELADIFESKTDSLVQAVGEESSQLNTESIESALKSILSVFGDDADQKEDQKSRGIGFLTMFFSTIGYFVLILFNYDYFDGIRKKYFGGLVKSRLGVLMDDFDKSFLKYIRLRTRIVLILAVVYTTAFVILDMPGTFLLVIMIVLLSYIPYLQYLVLIPLMIGCLVLSIENGPGFLFYFGITFGVFILATLLEELLLTPRIMEKNIGMNPVIMVLAASLGNFVFGIPGLLIGIPLASLILIYVKRYFLTSYEVISLEEKGKKEK